MKLSNPDLDRQTVDAELRVNAPETQASLIELNQPATITLQDRFPARVVHVDPTVQNGSVSIDLKFRGPQPREARSDLPPAAPSRSSGFHGSTT